MKDINEILDLLKEAVDGATTIEEKQKAVMGMLPIIQMSLKDRLNLKDMKLCIELNDGKKWVNLNTILKKATKRIAPKPKPSRLSR